MWFRGSLFPRLIASITCSPSIRITWTGSIPLPWLSCEARGRRARVAVTCDEVFCARKKGEDGDDDGHKEKWEHRRASFLFSGICLALGNRVLVRHYRQLDYRYCSRCEVRAEESVVVVVVVVVGIIRVLVLSLRTSGRVRLQVP
jgi:hypothetical protein